MHSCGRGACDWGTEGYGEAPRSLTGVAAGTFSPQQDLWTVHPSGLHQASSIARPICVFKECKLRRKRWNRVRLIVKQKLGQSMVKMDCNSIAAQVPSPGSDGMACGHLLHKCAFCLLFFVLLALSCEECAAMTCNLVVCLAVTLKKYAGFSNCNRRSCCRRTAGRNPFYKQEGAFAGHATDASDA